VPRAHPLVPHGAPPAVAYNRPEAALRLRGGAAEEEIEFPSFVKDRSDFNHVVRIFNTNMDGSRTVLFGLIGIKGIGRRFGDAVIKRSGVDGTKRIGELTAEEIEKLVQVMEKPLDYDIPVWMLNRRKDYVTGKDLHNHTNKWDFQVKTDIERLVKMRAHRGLRHAWGYKVAPFPPASCM
jgi:small subunit ribosomal protein S18e